MKKELLLNSLVVITTFLLAYYGRKLCSPLFQFTIDEPILKIVEYYAWWLFPSILAIGYMFGHENIIENIGLKHNFTKGLLFSFFTVLPMLLSSTIFGQINTLINPTELVQKTLLAGVLEEYLFRGFLFGLLFLKCGWGFIPSSLLGALIFGMGHVYQGYDLSSSIGIFLITGVGAVWFAWLYVEWNYNLWVPIFLHVLMNLSWTLFDISSNALGAPLANFFRIITIALTVVITIRNSKRDGFKVNKTNLWYHMHTI
jgi:membrane protease YdiL (CAAX protease family)